MMIRCTLLIIAVVSFNSIVSIALDIYWLPSYSPTLEPSYTPTKHPTQSPINSVVSVSTTQATQEPITHETTPISERHSVKQTTTGNETIFSREIIISVIVTAIIICGCICGFFVYKIYQKTSVSNTQYQATEIIASTVQRRSSSVSIHRNEYARTDKLPVVAELQNRTISALIQDYLKSQTDVNKIISEESSSEEAVESALNDVKPDTVELLAVGSWLKFDVKLPIYYKNFVQNGYETLEFIKEIVEEKELEEIGILSKQHQVHILDAIRRINGNDTVADTKYNNREIRNNENDIEHNQTMDRGSIYSEGPKSSEGPKYSEGQFINASKVEDDDVLHERNDSVNDEFVIQADDETSKGNAIHIVTAL